ncbi:hypothetical protein Ciccas_011670 [Cichlidogyrus casuarinus]|uniref:Uncharacterized protein n=1 Tax=Cichlidogyrus casuarinus TaxID=1844966 RepID=A0ABD2PQK7_9PLAT
MWLYGVLGATALLFLVILGVLTVKHKRRTKERKREQHPGSQSKTSLGKELFNNKIISTADIDAAICLGDTDLPSGAGKKKKEHRKAVHKRSSSKVDSLGKGSELRPSLQLAEVEEPIENRKSSITFESPDTRFSREQLNDNDKIIKFPIPNSSGIMSQKLFSSLMGYGIETKERVFLNEQNEQTLVMS